MQEWIATNQKHLIVWAVLLVYLVSANQLYVRFILKDGKPVSKNDPLPSETRPIVYQLSDTLQPVRRDGENLYALSGYAFFQDDPLEQTLIRIVLYSPTLKLTFPTQAAQFPDMIRSLSGYQPGMDGAQFSLLLSINTIKPGTYQICILLDSTYGEDQDYVMTNGTILKTPNTITYKLTP
ncbi:MAG: hypothetical protein ABSE06_19090 [Anaerolineaceae bacterium]|jgi:hypothetical protein